MLERIRDFAWPRNWRVVQSFLSSRAAQLSALIPIAGYSVLLSDFLAPLWVFPDDQLGVDISWRPRFIYFGLLCILIAQAIFFLRCHWVARKYSTSAEFEEAEGRHLSIAVSGRGRAIKKLVLALSLIHI